MKLRTASQSIRLRLSQQDLARLLNSGQCLERIGFPGGNALEYGIWLSDSEAQVSVSFENDCIAVILPAGLAQPWLETEQEGIYTELPAAAERGGRLSLVIEKDFQCLHRDGEAGRDNFSHPLKDKE